MGRPHRVDAPGLHRFDRLLSGRLWLLIATAIATATSLFGAFPTYDNLPRYDRDWAAVQHNADHPFDQKGLISTDRAFNFTFRVTVPLLGGLLGLSRNGYLVVQGLFGVALLAATAHLVDRLTGSRRLGALTAITVGLMWAGSCAFVELRANFDAVAISLLVLAMASRRWPVVLLCTFLATWTDERALPAAAFVLLFHHVVESRDLNPVRALKDPRCLAVGGAVVLHVVTRYAASAAFDIVQPSNFNLHHAADQLGILPVGSWTALEGLWFFVAIGAVALVKARQRLVALAYLGTIAAVLIANITVVDVTRSMAYLLPAGLAGMAVVVRYCDPKVVRTTLYVALLVTLAWPMYYVGGATGVYWFYPLPLVIVRNLAGLGGGIS